MTPVGNKLAERAGALTGQTCSKPQRATNDTQKEAGRHTTSEIKARALLVGHTPAEQAGDSVGSPQLLNLAAGQSETIQKLEV